MRPRFAGENDPLIRQAGCLILYFFPQQTWYWFRGTVTASEEPEIARQAVSAINKTGTA